MQTLVQFFGEHGSLTEQAFKDRFQHGFLLVTASAAVSAGARDFHTKLAADVRDALRSSYREARKKVTSVRSDVKPLTAGVSGDTSRMSGERMPRRCDVIAGRSRMSVEHQPPRPRLCTWLLLLLSLALLQGAAAATRRPGGRAEPSVPLRVSELMYHPPVNDAEFIELLNTGGEALNLGGMQFIDGIDYRFARGTVVEPGAYVVLVASAETFAVLYPGVPFLGEYDGRLDNGGETITLAYSGELPVLSLTYGERSPWPEAADGLGYSLVALNPDGDLDSPESWRASTGLGGSPGGEDIDPGIPRVVINEALTHTDLPQVDTIELFNPTTTTADIRGWLLTDDRRQPAKARIPDDSQYVLGPGAYAVISEHVFGDSPGNLDGSPLPGFFLSSHGEGLYLFSADANGKPTGYADGVELTAAANGVSFGRYETSEGKIHFVAQREVTLGAANAGPKVGPVVISELHYHPLGDDIEYLVLSNSSETQVNLWDDQDGGTPENTWEIKGIGFSFAPGTSLAAGASLVVADSEPATFRARYQVPDSIEIQGPFGNAAGDNDGALSNGGETVILRWPDVPDEEEVPWVEADRISYDDRAPWPDADGNGLALQRLALTLYGNDPASWQAKQPCFGAACGAGGAGDLLRARRLSLLPQR